MPSAPWPAAGIICSGVEHAADARRQAQALQARGRQHDGVVLAFVELAQPGVEVAAQRLDAQVGRAARAAAPRRRRLEVPTQRALRQLGQRRRSAARRRRRAGPRARAPRPARSPAAAPSARPSANAPPGAARPSSSAVSSSLTNRPLPPTLDSARSRIWSPRVVMPSSFDAEAEARGEQVAHMFGLPQREAALAGGDGRCAAIERGHGHDYR